VRHKKVANVTGSWAFSAAVANILSALRDCIISTSSVDLFQHQLKAFLFRRSICC